MHSFREDACVCVCVGHPKSHCGLLEFWPPFWPPVMTVKFFVQLRGLMEIPCCGEYFALLGRFWIFSPPPSLSSAKILSYENTDNHMLTLTQKHLWSITRFLCPFAFPAVWSCRAPWHYCGFSILFLQWQKLCAALKLITDIRKSLSGFVSFCVCLVAWNILLVADLFSQTVEIWLDGLTFSLNFVIFFLFFYYTF